MSLKRGQAIVNSQQCTVSCAQIAVLRNMPYEEIFETIANRQWENEDDFGADLFDLIRRRKRVKRAINNLAKQFLNNTVASSNGASCQISDPMTSTILGAFEELLEALEEAAPVATAAGLIGLATMVVPHLRVPTALSGSPPTNFNGPQPGQPGGINCNKIVVYCI